MSRDDRLSKMTMKNLYYILQCNFLLTESVKHENTNRIQVALFPNVLKIIFPSLSHVSSPSLTAVAICSFTTTPDLASHGTH